jgi:hypothetical protein
VAECWRKTEVIVGRTLNQVLAKLPAGARRSRRVAEIIAEEKSLQDLRKAMNKTQIDVA